MNPRPAASLRLVPAWCSLALVLAACPEPPSEVMTTSAGSASDGTTGSSVVVSTAGSTSRGETTVMTTDGSTLGSSSLGSSTLGVDSTATGPTAVCGDGIIEAEETCDDDNAEPGDGCDEACAVEAGWACEQEPSACAEVCGDAMVVGDEVCDGEPAGGCTDLGFTDGTLACDPTTCALDSSGCFFVEELQNDNGMCSATEIGCSDDEGTFGNPQDQLECYQSSLSPPLELTAVEYSLGGSVPLPDALELVVREWAGSGSLPGLLVDTAALDLADIVTGLHTVTLRTPIVIPTASFCVGLRGSGREDGFRVDFTDTGSGDRSFFLAPNCGEAGSILVSSFSTTGHFCIRPTVTSPMP